MIFNSTKERYIFYTIPVILFILIPIFLITGPFLSDMSISLISLLFLAYCIKKKNFSFFKNNFFYFFLIFWLYLVFNSLFFNFNFDSLKISFFYIRYGIFVTSILALLNVDDGFIKYFFYCILLCFSSLILDGFYEYFILKDNIRVSSFFGDEKILGSYLSRLWPMFFALSLIFLNKKDRLFNFIVLIFIFSEILIFLSAERSAFFNINLSAIFVILLSKNLLRLRLLILLSSLLLILIISFIDPTAKKRVIDQTLFQMNLVTNIEMNLSSNTDNIKKKYIFSQQHQEIYTSAYKMFLDNKLLGIGVKNFRHKCHEEKYYVDGKKICYTHPHNSYLQILTETGIMGFSFLVLVLLIFCKYIYKHLRLKFQGRSYFNDFQICILSGIAVYLWPFIPTGNIFNNWLNIILILNLPLLIWYKKLNKT